MELPGASGGLTRTGTGFVFTRAYLQQIATNITADTPTGTWLVECSAFLFVNNNQPTGASVYADFTKPTWTGYANVDPLSWDNSLEGVSGVSVVSALVASWTVGADPDDSVYGWGLVQGTNLIGAELFEEPVTPQVGEILTMTPELTIAQ